MRLNQSSLLAFSATALAASLLSLSQAAHALPLVLASIGVFGPNSETLTYEKIGDTIHLRVCTNNTLKKDIESESGCQLAPGTSEITMSQSAFRSMAGEILPSIGDDAPLSPSAAKEASAVGKKQRLAELQQQLDALTRFKREHPKDYDQKREKSLKAEIKCVKDSKADFSGIIAANDQSVSIVDRLLSDMDGKPVKLSLNSSNNSAAFKLLRAVAAVDTCSSSKVAAASVGYLCRVGSHVWKIEADNYPDWDNNLHRTYTDLTTGKKVTEPLLKSDLAKAAGSQKACSPGFHLPSGYPANLRGMYGFSNKESEFATLESDGFRDVIPGIKGDRFWSSSRYGGVSETVFEYYDGSTGKNGTVALATANLICVSDP